MVTATPSEAGTQSLLRWRLDDAWKPAATGSSTYGGFRLPLCFYLLPGQAILPGQDLLPSPGSIAIQNVLPRPFLLTTLLGPFVVGSSLMAVKGSGPKHKSGERTYSFYLEMTQTKTIQNNSEAYGRCATNKVNFPQRKEGKGLPKYGSQSETTIDSCP